MSSSIQRSRVISREQYQIEISGDTSWRATAIKVRGNIGNLLTDIANRFKGAINSFISSVQNWTSGADTSSKDVKFTLTSYENGSMVTKQQGSNSFVVTMDMNDDGTYTILKLTNTGGSRSLETIEEASDKDKASFYLEKSIPSLNSSEAFESLLSVVEKNVETEGIYRISASLEDKNELLSQIQSGKTTGIESLDVHVAASAIKDLLKQIPSDQRVLDGAPELKSKAENQGTVKDWINTLPTEKKAFLHILVSHLGKVAESSETNQMTVANLAIVYAPNLFPEMELAHQELALAEQRNAFVEFLVKNREAIFQA